MSGKRHPYPNKQHRGGLKLSARFIRADGSILRIDYAADQWHLWVAERDERQWFWLVGSADPCVVFDVLEICVGAMRWAAPARRRLEAMLAELAESVADHRVYAHLADDLTHDPKDDLRIVRSRDEEEEGGDWYEHLQRVSLSDLTGHVPGRSA